MYRLYVDEVGTDDLLHLDIDRHRYLSLTGLVMNLDGLEENLTVKLNWIKTEILGHDPDDPIVFHRKDILGRKGPYGCLVDPQKNAKFDRAIIRMIESTQFDVITALIDKKWMVRQKHWIKSHPYHYLMEILVEKYAQFLERRQDIGDIMPEARQGKKDELLQCYFQEVKNKGTEFLTTDRIHRVIPSRNLKFRTKKNNIAGLQLCDLIAHPSHIYVRECMGHNNVNLGPFSSQIIRILEKSKYDRSKSGKIIGYGIKHLP